MVFESKFGCVEPSEKFQGSVSNFFWHKLDEHAERTLILDHNTGRKWTGAQVKVSAERIASQLIDMQLVKPGDVCVFFYRNADHIHLAALGVLFAGGAVCAGSHLDPVAEQRYMLEALEPVLVFAEANLCHRLEKVRAETGLKFQICLMNDQEQGHEQLFIGRQEEKKEEENGTPKLIGFHKHLLQPALASSPGRLPVPVEPSQAAFILFTSGSTGHPKPVARTHWNSLNVCYSMVPELWQLNEGSVLAGHLQLDHGTGTFNFKMTFTLGLKLIVMDGYDQATLLNAIERHGITDCLLGSALLHNLITSSETSSRDLSSLQNLLAVGSPLASRSAALQFMDRWPQLSVRQTFGSTETGFTCIVPRDSAREEPESAGVGEAMANVTFKLIDQETGAEISQFDTEGELLVSGPTVCPGYMGAKYVEQSRSAFLANGFYKTNDICHITPGRRLVVRGRCNEVLHLYDGWKVLPYEIESVLLTHPAVQEAAVIGVPHPELPTQHAPRAYIVPREAWRGKLTEEALKEYAAARLSGPKHLVGGVKLMDDFPRISVGKVDKRRLRAMDGYL